MSWTDEVLIQNFLLMSFFRIILQVGKHMEAIRNFEVIRWGMVKKKFGNHWPKLNNLI